jgi:4-amino-4-deoxy-L-arabinose transferase-like glycosyltransferase
MGGNVEPKQTQSDAPRVPAFWWIIGLAVLTRLVWAAAVPVVAVSDSAAYQTMARHLAAGHGYSLEPFAPGLTEVTPTAYWAIGAPAVYAGAIAVFGDSAWPIVAVNLLANVLTLALLMRLAARWFSPVHAAAAGVCLALWPGQITFVTIYNSELLFAFGMLLVLSAWCWRGPPAWLRVPLVGVLLGLTCLVRPTALLFPVLLVIITVAQREGLWRPLLQAGIASLIMVAVILPWSMRNQRELGEFVLVSANGGANLWMGNHPGTDGAYAPLPPETAEMSEVQRDRYLKEKAKDYIKAEPVAFAKRTLIKAVKLHDRETIGVLWNSGGIEQRFGSTALVGPLKLGSTAYWWLMLGAGLVGMLMLWLRRGPVRGFFAMLFHPTVVFWGYFLSVHAVIVIQDRYHWPSVPFIAALASLPIVALLKRFGVVRDQPASAAAPAPEASA